MVFSGGERWIRTPDTVARMPDFESGAFVHSATSPMPLIHQCFLENRAQNECPRIRSLTYLWPIHTAKPLSEGPCHDTANQSNRGVEASYLDSGAVDCKSVLAL